MNQKELGELRRRFRPDKGAVSRVYGCYVNSSREVVSDLDEPLGMMTQEEAEKFLSLLKKPLSGALGRNLIDIVFSTQQVMEGRSTVCSPACAPAVCRMWSCAGRFIRRSSRRWTWGSPIT